MPVLTHRMDQSIEKMKNCFTLRPIASGGFFGISDSKYNLPDRSGQKITGHFNTSRPYHTDDQTGHEDLMPPDEDRVGVVRI